MNKAGKIVCACVLFAAACGKTDAPEAGGKGGKGKGMNKLEYPVQVAPIESRTVQYTVTAPGSIDAFQQVQITSRVAGAVDKVSFVEGQAVKESDVLVTIESERYQLALDAAKTALVKSQASAKSAQAELDRRQSADKDHPGLIPGEEIEQKATAVDTAKADVESARQAVRVAELNLRDSYVHTPIAGVVQTRTVQAGQYLATGTVLATILQRDPMLLRFQVQEEEAPRLKPGMTAMLTLKESARSYPAKITLVGGAADPSTRLVPITAEIDDTQHQYWLRPGAFCEVSVAIGDARKGIVVPTLAVQPTEQGNVVFIVDSKNIAHARPVDLGMHTADGGVEITRASGSNKIMDGGLISNGFQDGELIVVRGLEPLAEGAPVKIMGKTTLAMAQVPDAGVPAGSSSQTPAPAADGTDSSAAPAADGTTSGKHKHGAAQ